MTSRTFRSRTQAKIARIVQHVRSEIVDDLCFVHRYFQQRCIENLLALVGQTLSNLLTHTRTLQSQILSCQPLLGELEDVPLAAVEASRLRVITYLHRAKEIRNQLCREVVVLQIFFSGKSNIAAAGERIDVFTLGSGNSRKVSFALELLIDVVDLQLCIGIVLGIVSDSLALLSAGSTMIIANATPRAFINWCRLLL